MSIAPVGNFRHVSSSGVDNDHAQSCAVSVLCVRVSLSVLSLWAVALGIGNVKSLLPSAAVHNSSTCSRDFTMRFVTARVHSLVVHSSCSLFVCLFHCLTSS